jgi:hypothetical protein
LGGDDFGCAPAFRSLSDTLEGLSAGFSADVQTARVKKRELFDFPGAFSRIVTA